MKLTKKDALLLLVYIPQLIFLYLYSDLPDKLAVQWDFFGNERIAAPKNTVFLTLTVMPLFLWIIKRWFASNPRYDLGYIMSKAVINVVFDLSVFVNYYYVLYILQNKNLTNITVAIVSIIQCIIGVLIATDKTKIPFLIRGDNYRNIKYGKSIFSMYLVAAGIGIFILSFWNFIFFPLFINCIIIRLMRDFLY